MGPVHLLVSVLVAIAAVSPAAPAMARESQAVRRASPSQSEADAVLFS
jgi:hypothetical protein